MQLTAKSAIAVLIATAMTLALVTTVVAQETPTTPEDFGARFMTAMNSKDAEAVRKMHFPGSVDSPMKQMLDGLLEAELNSGQKFTKFEILPVPKDLSMQHDGPDGKTYQFNLPVTNMVKISAMDKDSSMSSTVPIGMKEGKYYLLDPEPVRTPEPTK